MVNKTGTYVIIVSYLFSLIAVGLYFFFQVNNKKKVAPATEVDEEKQAIDIIDDHFLASRSFGTVLLTLTTFASVFSGYTVVGIPAETFHNGFQTLRWIPAIFILIGMVIVLYPRLRQLGVHYQFRSPTDLIIKRYNSDYLCYICIFSQVTPALLYLLGQFKAIHSTVVSITGTEFHGLVGAAVIGCIIFGLEIIGGLKTVAFTDAIQSTFLIFGFVTVPFLLLNEYGSLNFNMKEIFESEPHFFNAPTAKENVSNCAWLMSLVSFPLYPHLIQRLYAAKDIKSLRRTWTIMSFSPWLTVPPGILLGLIAKAKLLPDIDSTRVFGMMMDRMLSFGWFSYFTGSVVLTASLAAIMSTADSVLIAISNIVTLDIYKRYLAPSATLNQQLWISKLVSFICVLISVLFSTSNINLSILLELQGGILIQILPAFLCALYTDRFGSTSLICGNVVGIIITVTIPILVYANVVPVTDFYGLSPGLFGAVSNIFFILIVQLIFAPENNGTISVSDIQNQTNDLIEPIFHHIGRFLAPLLIVFFIIVNPFFFKPGPISELYFGFPHWSLWILGINILWCIVTIYLCQLWEDTSES